MKIVLSAEDIEKAAIIGQKRAEAYANKFGSYNHASSNSLGTQVAGIFGEMAVKHFLFPRFEEGLVYDWSDYKGTNPDFSFVNSPIKIEVKTWRRRHWKDLGRCITPTQRKSNKFDVIIWTVIEEDNSVTLEGWNTVTDIKDTHLTKTGYMKLNNYQLKSGELRPMDSLLFYLTRV